MMRANPLLCGAAICICGLALSLLLPACRADNPDVEPIPSGPGRVSGSFSYRVPRMFAYSTAPGLPAGGVEASFMPSFNVSLYTPGLNQAFRIVNINRFPAMTAVEPGLWQTEIRFEELPLGSYELRASLPPSTGPKQSPGEPGSWYQGAAFTLSKADAVYDELAETAVFHGGLGAGRIHGKILLDGNPLNGESVRLAVHAAADSELKLPSENASWTVEAVADTYGRLFYEIRDVPLGEYMLIPFGGNSSSLLAQPSLSSEGQPLAGRTVKLDADFPEMPLDFRVSRAARAQGTTSAEWAKAAKGVIACTLNISGTVPWEGDVVVVAERSAPMPSKRDSAYHFIQPWDFGYGASVSFNLGLLEPGSYTVKVLRLGETNAEAPELLAQTAAPVELTGDTASLSLSVDLGG
jgi:hypothetical protein